MTGAGALLIVDLAGTAVFALNGALTAIRAARLDIVGVLTLGMMTALGGGIIRDVIIDSLPPATFRDWRYLVVAAAGALVAFVLGRSLDRVGFAVDVLDAVGLSLFAVAGATKALGAGLGPLQAVILGAVTAVGGGTVRDVMIGRVPTVLTSGLYAVPALVGAAITVVGAEVGPGTGAGVWVVTSVGAAACFLIRLVGIRFDLNAPVPPGSPPA
ncbi:trimeric intracellular cation channel family protein [Terrabacter aerolatus]|uniref:Membrane protein n=1 Tax=Terrabacter aerolatus TaxID=422442 RepID=A0A512D0M5_9MICO|nr:TRIC cation channel family protein [Terrabacter aerolatus]GEO30016.1 membrane protein [Terrabacter aerolatus]